MNHNQLDIFISQVNAPVLHQIPYLSHHTHFQPLHLFPPHLHSLIPIIIPTPPLDPISTLPHSYRFIYPPYFHISYPYSCTYQPLSSFPPYVLITYIPSSSDQTFTPISTLITPPFQPQYSMPISTTHQIPTISPIISTHIHPLTSSSSQLFHGQGTKGMGEGQFPQ